MTGAGTPAATAPGQAALAALVDGHFFGDGPNPLQLVCMTEDDNDTECDTLIAEVEPGTTWNELEHRMAGHALGHHFRAAAPASEPAATTPGIYRRKPAEVEAWRVQTDNLAEVAAWCDGMVYDDSARWNHDLGGVVMPDGHVAHVKCRAWGVIVCTPDGDQAAEFGDWITRSVNGAFRVYDTVTFKAIYEPVPDGEA